MCNVAIVHAPAELGALSRLITRNVVNLDRAVAATRCQLAAIVVELCVMLQVVLSGIDKTRRENIAAQHLTREVQLNKQLRTIISACCVSIVAIVVAICCASTI